LFAYVKYVQGGKDNVIGIVTRQWAGRPRRSGMIIGMEISVFSKNVHTGSGAYPDDYSFPGGKVVGA